MQVTLCKYLILLHLLMLRCSQYFVFEASAVSSISVSPILSNGNSIYTYARIYIYSIFAPFGKIIRDIWIYEKLTHSSRKLLLKWEAKWLGQWNASINYWEKKYNYSKACHHRLNCFQRYFIRQNYKYSTIAGHKV